MLSSMNIFAEEEFSDSANVEYDYNGAYDENTEREEETSSRYDDISTSYDEEFDEEMKFSIVGSSEANSLKGKISNESPVGKALIGKKVGDTVNVETQAGEFQYRVLNIERTI